MAFDTTIAPAAQEAPHAHPSAFDKLQWLGPIMGRTDLTASARRVVVMLAHHHNSKTGQCNPSLTGLAKGSGLSDRMVSKALTELKTAGIIDWVPGDVKTKNLYTLRDVPLWDFEAKAATIPAPAKRGKGPASSSGATVIPFPGPTQGGQSDTLPTEPQFGTLPNSSSVPLPNSSSDKPLKGNPDKGYPVGEVVEEDETETASVNPASPLCPLGGDGSSMAGEDEKQPEAETRPADGRFTFDELSTQWKAWAREWAEGQFQGDQTFIDQASKGFKAVAIERGWRITEDKWREVWRAYSMQEHSKRPAPKRDKGAPAI